MKIAVVLTAFNRKNKTLACLTSLEKQVDMPEYDVYLCDDGSTDGTKEAVLDEFHNVTVIQGTGALFWTRGMALAMSAAVSKKYDYYLMVNDDVEFFDNMWQTMLYYFRENNCIGVTGCTKSKQTGLLTYSGAKFYHEDKKRFVDCKIAPDGVHDFNCDVANWNCFLISDEVVGKVGHIDPIYEHSFGDFDYSLRMRSKGIPIYISKEYIGYCENNSSKNTYRDGSLSRKKRIEKILSPNGLPLKSWFTFTSRYYGAAAFRNFVVPYVKFIFSLIGNKNC
ncbi:glycosyltransferase family 2 protein [Neobacillus drentensis]|uniref:glycosyltransferase family 2 protein n=1 Tax=Neobacillus drentensis TaxID=220684 RepID=UPI0030005174